VTGRDAFAWLDAILSAACAGTRRVGPSAWQMGRAAHGPRIDAAVNADWLSLATRRSRAPRVCAAGSTAAALLEANAALAHGVRFVLDDAPPAPVSARADIALHRDAGLADADFDHTLTARVRASCDALVHAARAPLASLRSHAGPRMPGSRPDAGTLTTLAALHWPVHGADGERVRVDLDCAAGAVRQARIEQRNGPVHASWDLRTDLPDTLEPDARGAIAVLLLRTAAALPRLRPLTRAGEFIGFEIMVPPPADATDLDRALGALSLAAAMAGTEAEALAASPDLARTYLSARLRAAARPGRRRAPFSAASLTY